MAAFDAETETENLYRLPFLDSLRTGSVGVFGAFLQLCLMRAPN